MTRIGVLPLGRQTFDVAYAEEMAARAFEALDATDAEIVGPRELLYDAASPAEAIDSLVGEDLDLLVVMQVTFTDASMTEVIGRELPSPIALWAFPEERTGGRLRLNSFCGINLAGHALQRIGRRYRYLYAHPGDDGVGERVVDLADAPDVAPGQWPVPTAEGLDPGAITRADAARVRLAGSRVAVVGDHPTGFVPCGYDAGAVAELLGTTVDKLALPEFFARARAADAADVAGARSRAASSLEGLDAVDQTELDNSLRFYPALRSLAATGGYAGFAVRCWPECFTEYGGAFCGSAAMSNDDGVPAACEADAYGVLTALALQWVADGPALVADLVDVDVDEGTAVLWHCGKAPVSMADPAGEPPRASVHSNRRKPLLNEFAFKPGRVTIARLSQRRNEHALVVGSGEMVRAPLAFSGTAGVVRFDRPAADVVETIMAEGLEHHYGFVYGDVRDELYALAEGWDLPVVVL